MSEEGWRPSNGFSKVVFIGPICLPRVEVERLCTPPFWMSFPMRAVRRVSQHAVGSLYVWADVGSQQLHRDAGCKDREFAAFIREVDESKEDRVTRLVLPIPQANTLLHHSRVLHLTALETWKDNNEGAFGHKGTLRGQLAIITFILFPNFLHGLILKFPYCVFCITRETSSQEGPIVASTTLYCRIL